MWCNFFDTASKLYRNLHPSHVLHALSNGTKIFEFYTNKIFKILFLFFGKVFFVFLAFNFFLNSPAEKVNSLYCEPWRGAHCLKSSLKFGGHLEGQDWKKSIFSAILDFLILQKIEKSKPLMNRFYQIYLTYRTKDGLSNDTNIITSECYFQSQTQIHNNWPWIWPWKYHSIEMTSVSLKISSVSEKKLKKYAAASLVKYLRMYSPAHGASLLFSRRIKGSSHLTSNWPSFIFLPSRHPLVFTIHNMKESRSQVGTLFFQSKCQRKDLLSSL